MSSKKRSLVLVGLVCLFAFLAASLQAQETGAQAVTIPPLASGEQLQLPGFLHKPNGNGPFPALVILVGCEGIAQPDSMDAKATAQWLERFVGWGYVTLAIDSFSPRGHYSVCEDVSLVNADMRSHDAFAAKSYLGSLPFVDSKNIGVVGWSHGGWSIMKIIDAAFRDSAVSPFKAAVAIYPFCQPLANPDTPVLVLIGRKDDWCPASLAESLNREYKNWNWKPEFSLTVYPDATHAFDVEWPKGGVDFGGHHLDYDPKATADAITQTKAFLAKNLATR